MLNAKQRKHIIELWNEEQNISAVERSTGHCRDTVRQVLKKAGLYPVKKGASSLTSAPLPYSASTLEPLERLEEKLNDGRIELTILKALINDKIKRTQRAIVILAKEKHENIMSIGDILDLEDELE